MLTSAVRWRVARVEADALTEAVRWRVLAIAGRAFDDHPDRVAAEAIAYMDDYTEAVVAVALLHDSVEDGHTTLDELETVGVPLGIRKAVDVLTRREDDRYDDYIQRVRDAGGLAVIVKRADLKVNLARCVVDGRHSLAARYQRALEQLDQV